MTDTVNDYKLKVDELRRLIRSRRNFEPAVELALEMHSITHTVVRRTELPPSAGAEQCYDKEVGHGT
ncbi:hypothetical protein V3C10_09200 [[Clostridium] symbiosum]|uniref:hypothetical protein n=1 Tax=Clostridium symbiosum TaxID=1512 RepID=UPI001D090B3B|nr:hypothetical protein [[Clostridium] symbiosum]MCB6607593.1 hypothetical protein [[Clostridium] symbiosum]MCB6929270.1 hypothetical protein [[Clostridium] symbiosum]